MLRSTWRALETESRLGLHGHERGKPGPRSHGPSRQLSALPVGGCDAFDDLRLRKIREVFGGQTFTLRSLGRDRDDSRIHGAASYRAGRSSPGGVEYLLIIGRNHLPVKCGGCADAVVMAVPGTLVKNLLWSLDAKRPTFFQEVRYLGYNIAWSS